MKVFCCKDSKDSKGSKDSDDREYVSLDSVSINKVIVFDDQASPASQARLFLSSVFLEDGVPFTLFKAMECCCQSNEHHSLRRMFEADSKHVSSWWMAWCVFALTFDYVALIYRGNDYGNEGYMPLVGFSFVDEPQHGALLTHMGSDIVQRWPFYIFSVVIAARVVWAMRVVCCPHFFDSVANNSQSGVQSEYRFVIRENFESDFCHSDVWANFLNSSSSSYKRYLWPILVVWSSYHWYRLLVFKFLALYNNMLERESCEQQGQWLHYFPEIGRAACTYCLFDGIGYVDSLTVQGCFDALMARSNVPASIMIDDLVTIQNYTVQHVDFSPLLMSDWSGESLERLVGVLGNFSNNSFTSVCLTMGLSSETIAYDVWSPLFRFIINRTLVNLTLSNLDFDVQSLHDVNGILQNQGLIEYLDLSCSNAGSSMSWFPPHLVYLNVSSSGFDGTNMAYLLNFLFNNTILRTLDVSSNPGFSFEALYQFMSAVAQSRVNALYLNDYDLYHIDWSRFGLSLMNASVEKLSLSNTALYDDNFISFIPYLLQANLGSIDLSFNDLSYGVVEWFTYALNYSLLNKTSFSLRHLNLNNNQMDKDDLLAFFPLVRALKLESLSLDNHDYFSDGLYQFGLSILNTSIETLSLKGCDGGDYFIQGIMDSLVYAIANVSNASSSDPIFPVDNYSAYNHSVFRLSSLDLSDSKLSITFLQQFLSNLSSIFSLDTLYLNNNVFYQSGIGSSIAQSVGYGHLKHLSLQGMNLHQEDIGAVCNPRVFKYLSSLAIGGQYFDDSDWIECANALVNVPEPNRLGRLSIGVDLPRYMVSHQAQNAYDLDSLSIQANTDLFDIGVRALCQVRVGSRVSNFDVDCREVLPVSSSASSRTMGCFIPLLLLIKLIDCRLSPTAWMMLLCFSMVFTVGYIENNLASVFFGSNGSMDQDVSANECFSVIFGV